MCGELQRRALGWRFHDTPSLMGDSNVHRLKHPLADGGTTLLFFRGTRRDSRGIRNNLVGVEQNRIDKTTSTYAETSLKEGLACGRWFLEHCQ